MTGYSLLGATNAVIGETNSPVEGDSYHDSNIEDEFYQNSSNEGYSHHDSNVEGESHQSLDNTMETATNPKTKPVKPKKSKKKDKGHDSSHTMTMRSQKKTKKERLLLLQPSRLAEKTRIQEEANNTVLFKRSIQQCCFYLAIIFYIKLFTP